MPAFIETQFPITRLSAESYRECKANNGQTLPIPESGSQYLRYTFGQGYWGKRKGILAGCLRNDYVMSARTSFRDLVTTLCSNWLKPSLVICKQTGGNLEFSLLCRKWSNVLFSIKNIMYQ